MSCCGGHDRKRHQQDHHIVDNGKMNQQETSKHHHRFMMVVCLTIPIAVIAGVFFTGGFSGPKDMIILAAALICPLMHLLMMPRMMKKGNDH